MKIKWITEKSEIYVTILKDPSLAIILQFIRLGGQKWGKVSICGSFSDKVDHLSIKKWN